MENQNASAEYPHIPAKGSLQTAMPMAALFFKLQRFFCGKAAGFPPPPLNAGLYSP